MTDTLKPCPFCGESCVEIIKWFNAPEGHFVSCENEDCLVAPQTVGKTRNQAIENWNTRKEPAND